MPVVAMPDGAQVSFPDEMPSDQIRSLILQKFPQAGENPGLLKSAATGALEGLGGMGDLRERAIGMLPEQFQGAGRFISNFNPVMPGMGNLPTSEQTKDIAQKLTGFESPQGQTLPEKIVQGTASNLANPISYAGPGSMALKAAGAALSGAGGEVGENIGGTAGRIAGSLAGGVTASKSLGPKAAKEVIPTESAIKSNVDSLYKQARASGVEFDAKKVGDEFATPAQQILTNGEKYGFTGGRDGTAPKTLGALDRLRDAPAGARVTASNMDALRIQLSTIAGETKDFKPTPDAKAATVAKRLLQNYLENPPEGHVVAGDAADYVNAVGQANRENAALQQLRDANRRINNAEVAHEGSRAVALDNKLKAEFRPILKNEKLQRGLNADQLSAIQTLNKGTPLSNTMSQLGRGHSALMLGLNLAPGLTHLMATSGASAPIFAGQAALSAGAYGAHRIAESLARNQAREIANSAARRSALYQQPQIIPGAPNQAQLLRSAILGLTSGR